MGLVSAWIILCSFGCGSEPDSQPALTIGKPHIVVVLVDQLRLDAMEAHAPGITELGRQGVHATHMRSAAPWTYPSVLSLFSGLYPQQHGADGEHDSNQLNTFDPEVTLLHELLKEQGYSTAAFVTNPFLQTWNSFHEGFDTYDVHFVGNVNGIRGRSKKVWKTKMFADSVNKSFKAHFAKRPLEGPEFTYVHYIDVHGPWGKAPFPGTYEDSIVWIDKKILELHEHMRERYDDELLFIVTSDHGTALGDDEEIGLGPEWRATKNSVYDFNLRIPFLVFPSKLVTEAQVITQPCSNVDVLPTLLEWLDLDAPVELPGVSLLPTLRNGTPLPEGRVLYARCSAFGFESDCVVRGDQKAVRFFETTTGDVKARASFDLASDPRELNSLGDDHWQLGPAYRKAESTLGVVFYPQTDDLEPQTQKALQELGYLK